MANPQAIENPFYLAVPAWALYPMVVLATGATVIASQATISGAYSITLQSIQLGYLPRMSVRHTSAQAFGQIYVPAVNWLLLIVVAVSVIGFGSSSRLASAYGVAVMGTMLATTILTFFLIRHGWGYPWWLCILATGFFLVIDATFLSSALLKVMQGGWLPLALGAAVFALMIIWKNGRAALAKRLHTGVVPLQPFLASLLAHPPQRVPGTAVFMTAVADTTPAALLHSLKHYKVLHERNVFLTVAFCDVPWVALENRVACEALAPECWRVVVRYGFMDRPDIANALELCGPMGLQVEPEDCSYFLSREKILPTQGRSTLSRWSEAIFSALARNASSAPDFFNIPTNRVVELGSRIQL
jgi:KUP system potassium uptake protein